MATLVVQLGHCYRTTGATGTSGEQQFATAVGNACVALLHGRGGWSVRKILADESGASYRGDAFVAVHCDGSTSTAARGASVGYRTPEGQALGQAWKRAYSARGWPGFRPDNYTSALAQYYGTGTAVAQGNRRAVIIECGFLTNPQDRALLTGPGGADRVALAIGDALGIPHGQQEEDDVSWTETLSWTDPNGQTTAIPASAWLGWTNWAAWKGAEAAQRNEEHLLAAKATQAAILAELQDDVSDADVLARLDEKIGVEMDQWRAQAAAAREADRAALVQAVRDSVPDEWVDTVLDQLGQRLTTGGT